MESEKEKHRRWLDDALAASPETSQTDLATALGVDKSAISKMLAGKRAIKSDELYRAAEFLGRPLPSAPGLAEGPATFVPAEGFAPIHLATAEGDRWLLDRDQSIDARRKAPIFESAAHVFGFYAPDSAAAPRFKAGE